MNTKLCILAVFALVISACSPMSKVSSRLRADWNIDRFEMRTPDGQTSIIENAGSIVLNRGGQGVQTFTAALAHAGQATETQFVWDNTGHTVSIKSSENEPRKVWIIVKSTKA